MAQRAISALAVAVLAGLPVAAEAQGSRGVYVGVSVGTHGERADMLTGTAPAIAVVGGVRVSRDWGAEVEFGRPTRGFARERTCQCFSFATSREDFDRLAVTERVRDTREVISTLSVGAIYQPQIGRWTPRLFMGVTQHRARETHSSTILAVPEGVDPVQAAAVRPPTSDTRTLGGVTVGAGGAYRVTSHLALGGDVRYDYGSIGDEINNVWRTSVRSVWSF